MNQLCSECGDNEGSKRCGQCKQVYYCSAECQKKAWTGHKLICGVNFEKYFLENKDSLQVEDFEIIKSLGEGNFTEVFKVEHRKYPGQYFALKICKMSKVKSLRRETDIFLEKHSLNKLKAAYQDSEMPCVKLFQTFKDFQNLYFLTELLDQKQEVWTKCRSYGFLCPKLAAYYFREVCVCVQKLHQQGIVHRDLKPENMFFRGDRVVLIDFGSSEDLTQPELRKVQIDDDPKRKNHVNFVGTSQYMAPECVRNKDVGMEADIWSLGCILYQFLTGLVPFRGASDYLIFRRSTEAKCNLDFIQSDQGKQLVGSCLQVDPKNRPTINQVLAHPFLQFESKPELQLWQQELRLHLNDFIERQNVYEFEGKDKFQQYFENQVIFEITNKYPEEDLQAQFDFYYKLCMFSIFGVDPENDSLEEEKEAVKKMADEARIRNAAKQQEDVDLSSSSSSQEKFEHEEESKV